MSELQLPLKKKKKKKRNQRDIAPPSFHQFQKRECDYFREARSQFAANGETRRREPFSPRAQKERGVRAARKRVSRFSFLPSPPSTPLFFPFRDE